MASKRPLLSHFKYLSLKKRTLGRTLLFQVFCTMERNFRIGNEWKTLLKIPKKRYDYAMVAIGNDRIAIVGGWLDGKIVDLVDLYNLQSKEWSSFKMKEKRSLCAAVAIDEKLYVFGGLKEVNVNQTLADIIHRNKEFLCVKCGKTCKSKSDLKKHAKLHGNTTKPYLCKMCNREPSKNSVSV